MSAVNVYLRKSFVCQSLSLKLIILEGPKVPILSDFPMSSRIFHGFVILGEPGNSDGRETGAAFTAIPNDEKPTI